MKSLKKIAAVSISLGLTLGIGAAAVPAQADYNACHYMQFCAWNDISYRQSTAPYINTKIAGQDLENISWSNDDKFSSVRSRTAGWSTALYEHSGARGKCLTIPSGASDPWLGDTWAGGVTWNDKVSSWRTNGPC